MDASVSERVGGVRNNDASLIEPFDLATGAPEA